MKCQKCEKQVGMMALRKGVEMCLKCAAKELIEELEAAK